MPRGSAWKGGCLVTAVGGASPASATGSRLATQLGAVIQAVRRWSLAGDQRAGSWARAEARQKQYAFLRRNWITLLALGSAVAAVLAVTVALTSDQFVRGLVVGAGLTGTAGMFWQWVVQATGTAPVMMGDLGEQWTAQELRKLRHQGWVLVNHVTLTGPDTDHVLVGPGGVVAIESKWSAKEWTPSSGQLRAAAEQVRRNARRLTLWQDLKTLDVGPVGSVVFLWGPGARGLPAPFDLDGTTIVPGRHASAWRTGLTGGRLTPQQVEAAWQVLDARCRTTDPRESREHPAPLSIGEWAGRAVLSLVAACAGFLAVTSVVATGLPWGLALAWWVLMLVLGVGVCRVPAVRYLGLAWTAGVIATAPFSAFIIAMLAL